MIKIITHRGLEPSREDYFAESSLEAFTHQLKRGYGIEFDLQVTRDRRILVLHDKNLSRITAGLDTRAIGDVDLDEILAMDFNGSHVTSFDKLLDLVETIQFPEAVSAVHVKASLQKKEELDLILEYLVNRDASKFYIFDVSVKAAFYLKSRNPSLRLAPSVSHEYDRDRYNDSTGGTLLSVDEVLSNKKLFDGVWLDEWDLLDKNNESKKFYTEETITKFKNIGFWVGLVTPELHGTSPGLIGGEIHEDSRSFGVLARRFKEIINLKPDAICTDYPDYIKNLLSTE